jgi:surface protein
MIDLFNIDVDKIKYNEEEIALIKLNGTIIYKPSKFYAEYNVYPIDESLKNGGLPYLFLRDNSQGDDKFTKIRITPAGPGSSEVTSDITTPCNQVNIVRLWYPEITSEINFAQSAAYNVWHINTSNITTMNRMFYDCNYLISMSAVIDTSNVTDMSYMFYGCQQLTSLAYINNWDTSNVTNMSYMFYNCNKLTSLDLSNFNTSNVTNMTHMFYNCDALTLTSSDVNNFDVSNVTNMSYMFHGCEFYYNPNLSKWDTGKVTNMSYMFYNCDIYDNYPRSLDLSNWDISNVTDMSYMFSKSNINYLYLFGWNINEETNIDNIFADSSIHSLYLDGCSNDTISKIINSEGFPSDDSDIQRYIYCEKQKCADLIAPKGWMFYYTDEDEDGDGYEVLISKGQYRNNEELIEVYTKIPSSFTNLNGLFSECINLKYVDTRYWTTYYVTDMGGMFYNCNSLLELDASFSTTSVKHMAVMFYNCASLTRLNLMYFDTSNVINMGGMFSGCSSLTSLDLRNFDTSKVPKANMKDMFSGCSSLHTLRLDNCDNDTISKIISVLPTEAIDGVTRTIYCKEANAEGLTAPTNWEFSYID